MAQQAQSMMGGAGGMGGGMGGMGGMPGANAFAGMPNPSMTNTQSSSQGADGTDHPEFKKAEALKAEATEFYRAKNFDDAGKKYFAAMNCVRVCEVKDTPAG
jgi:hypothetical protein